MKESISYSFLLNIIILFVFVCAAIITGIFSYYKAFRANTIIVNEIEKYEGFNCNSKESIAKKLNSISYNVPFEVKCKSGEDGCAIDVSLRSYKVYAYVLGNFKENFVGNVNSNTDYMDSYTVQCGNVDIGDDKTEYKCEMLNTYQYGVFTYMYTDLPVVSGLLRIPVYTKTRPLHDYRELRISGIEVYDASSFPSFMLVNYNANLKNISNDYAELIQNNIESDTPGLYMNDFGYGIKRIKNYKGFDLRDAFLYNDANEENIKALQNTGKKKCGNIPDWSIF